MNIRRQKYRANRITGMNQYNAARAAGYSHYTSIKSNRIEKGEKGCIADALERIGLTDKVLAQHAKEGLQANKVISANITYGDADEKTNDFIDVPDWPSRHKYLSIICELTDRIKNKPLVSIKEEHLHITLVGQLHELAKKGFHAGLRPIHAGSSQPD